jgi:hypothetical protein
MGSAAISSGKTVTSPLSILTRSKGGRLSFVQFMEDTFATLRTFRESGARYSRITALQRPSCR